MSMESAVDPGCGSLLGSTREDLFFSGMTEDAHFRQGLNRQFLLRKEVPGKGKTKAEFVHMCRLPEIRCQEVKPKVPSWIFFTIHPLHGINAMGLE